MSHTPLALSSPAGAPASTPVGRNVWVSATAVRIGIMGFMQHCGAGRDSFEVVEVGPGRDRARVPFEMKAQPSMLSVGEAHKPARWLSHFN